MLADVARACHPSESLPVPCSLTGTLFVCRRHRWLHHGSRRRLSSRCCVQGLSGTLALLAIFRKALPALPISIFLGVVVYLLTRTIVVPYITELTLNGVFM